MRSRSRSPYYRRNQRRSRSRSKSPRHRLTSGYGKSDNQRKRSRSPWRPSRSGTRRSRSPVTRYRSPKRKSRSPRKRSRSPGIKSPKWQSRSPRRYSRSPRKKSRSPRRYSRSPRKKSRSPGTKSRSPRRKSRSASRKSQSPQRRYRSPEKKPQTSGTQNKSLAQKSPSPRQRSSSVQNREGRISPSSNRRKPGSESVERNVSPKRKRSHSPNQSHQLYVSPQKQPRSPIHFSRQEAFQTYDRNNSSLQQQNLSPEKQRWQSQKDISPTKTETFSSRSVVYEHQKQEDVRNVPPSMHLNQSHSADSKYYDKNLSLDSNVEFSPGFLRQTLNQRFKNVDQKPLILEENITIGIQRSRNCIPSSTVNVSNVFDPSFFVMVHRTGEGKKPIFDREEIKAFHHDDRLDGDDDDDVFERRIISIQPIRSRNVSNHSRGSSRERSDYDNELTQRSPRVIRKEVSRSPWREKYLEVTRQRSPSPHGRHVGQTVHIRLDTEPDFKYEPNFGHNRQSYKTQMKMERIQNNPNDLRHNLVHRGQFDHRMDARAKIEARRTDSSRDRENWSDDRGGSERIVERERRMSGSSRSRSDSGRQLPDFSRRVDKYKYEAWRENPEIIPKGESYFEHDDREVFPVQSLRGRKRGGFNRGRARDGNRGNQSQTWDRSQRRNTSSYDNKIYQRESFGRLRRGYQGDNRPRGRGSLSRPNRGGLTSTRGIDNDKPLDERGHWKHDMFYLWEKTEDEKPSSTTNDT